MNLSQIPATFPLNGLKAHVPTVNLEQKRMKARVTVLCACVKKTQLHRLRQLVSLALPPVCDKCLTTSTQSQPRGRSSMLPPNLSNILRFCCFDSCSFFSFLTPPPSSPPPADARLLGLLAWNRDRCAHRVKQRQVCCRVKQTGASSCETATGASSCETETGVSACETGRGVIV